MIDKKVFPNESSLNFITDAGSPIKQLYTGSVGTDGIISLKKAGQKNIQDEINSFERSTDLYNIISRLSPEELAAQAQMQQEFFDATGLPKTYAEALQLIIDGQNKFESLPVEVKQRFDNDFNQWFATAGSPDWFKKIGFADNLEEKTGVVGNPIKEEVIKDEQER